MTLLPSMKSTQPEYQPIPSTVEECPRRNEHPTVFQGPPIITRRTSHCHEHPRVFQGPPMMARRSNKCRWFPFMAVSISSSFLFVCLLFLMSPALWKKAFGPIGPNSEVFQCKLQLVESIPEGLVYNSTINHLKTFKAWKILLRNVEHKLEIASSYWSLRGQDVYKHKTDWQGEDIFESLVKATKKGIKIDIAENLQPNPDTDDLSKIRGVRVKALNFTRLMGAGILHTKLWIADRKHFYVGSANFDWRSLTQVKEIGILATNCSELAGDMGKIWDVYWALGGPDKHVPSSWPDYFSTQINSNSPLKVKDSAEKNQEILNVFLSSSPPPFCAHGRSGDADAIVKIIDQSEKFVYIAVMDYFPTFIYGKNKQFWPFIDNALRRAAVDRNVEVRLLLSNWTHTMPDMKNHLKSLTDLNGIQHGKVKVLGKWFEVPSFTPDQAMIPFARVNHNKYMVTDKTGYIGTSNWSADYFVNTGGIGFAFSHSSKNSSDISKDMNDKRKSLRQQLQDLFERDWNSNYAKY